MKIEQGDIIEIQAPIFYFYLWNDVKDIKKIRDNSNDNIDNDFELLIENFEVQKTKKGDKLLCIEILEDCYFSKSNKSGRVYKFLSNKQVFFLLESNLNASPTTSFLKVCVGKE